MLQDLTPSSLSRSALRHRPIGLDTSGQERPVLTPRASRAKQHHEPHTTGGLPSGVALSKRTAKAKAPGTWLIYLVLGMLVTMLLLWIGQMVWNWGQTTADDLRYGRPRTTQVDHFVGQETGTTPSHFIAINLHGQVYVIEIPGGQANHSQIFIGPHLYGPGSDLAPVALSFPGDVHRPDLLIIVDGVQMMFRNTGTSFVPASS